LHGQLKLPQHPAAVQNALLSSGWLALTVSAPLIAFSPIFVLRSDKVRGRGERLDPVAIAY
jgi:hypothetical protein